MVGLSSLSLCYQVFQLILCRCLKFLVGVALKFEKLQRGFLWGDGVEMRKVHAVNWATVCRSKANGGLGIGRVAIKNKALLAKWAWRFGIEESYLWRKVIIAKYRLNSADLFWKGVECRKASNFAKAVAIVFRPDSRAATIMKENLVPVIGKGSRVKFWDISYGGSNVLKESFPRIYVLAIM